MKKKPLIAALLSLFCNHTQTQAKEEVIMVKPTGEYATIDMKPCMATLKAIDTGSEQERDKTIAQVKATPSKFNPVVFYHMSKALFDKNEKDDAAFWFYAGQLRARYDANRCADISARSGVAVLNQQFGAPINQYAMKDLTKLESIVNKVAEFDAKTPHDYDHRWINLHGMGAMLESMDGTERGKQALSLPESQWKAIEQKTRDDYMAGFKQALVELKARDQAK